MIHAPIPNDDESRLKILSKFNLDYNESKQFYNDIAFVASVVCGTDVAFVSFVDKDTQYFIGSYGSSLEPTPRAVSFCGHAICDLTNVMEVLDTKKDVRFEDNPLVIGHPHLSYYAGAPFAAWGTDKALGAVCAVGFEPRTNSLTAAQTKVLKILSSQVELFLEVGYELDVMSKIKSTPSLDDSLASHIEKLENILQKREYRFNKRAEAERKESASKKKEKNNSFMSKLFNTKKR